MAKRPIDPDKLTSDPRVEDPALSRGKDDTEIEDILSGLGEKSSPHRPEYDEFQDRGDVDSMLGSPSDSKFGNIPEDPADAEEAKHAAKHAEQMAEIDKLLKEVEASQDKQRKRQGHGRAQAYAINAGEAMRAGFMGEKGNYVDIPAKYDVAAGTEKKIALGDKLKNTAMNYESKEDERSLRKLLGEEGNKTKKVIATGANETKKEVEGNKIEATKARDKYLEGGRMERSKIAAAAIIGAKAMGINATAGSGNRVDQEAYQEAAKQAQRQVKEYVWDHPVSEHQNSKASDLVMSKERAKLMANKALDILEDDPRAEAFWGTDARKVLKGAIMQAADANVKFGGNGVANGHDIVNSLQMMGGLEDVESFIAANGIETLKAFVNNLDEQTDAAFFSLGAHRRRADEPFKQLPDVNQFGGGGGNAKAGVDPNVVGGMMKTVTSGGAVPPPNMNNPSKDVGGMIPQQPGQLPKKKMHKYSDYVGGGNGN